MPDYVVTGPDGRQLRFTGPEAPSQAMIDQGFQKLPNPQQAWQKAQGIGPAKVGERYLPTGGPMGILDVIRTALGGAERPASVAAQDPYGIQAWEKGAGPMPTPIMAETQAVGPRITAYHGSPYDFEKFDLGKIGTGEGAQAYGHGLYFAENPKVAQEYRDSLAYLTDDESRKILDVLPKPFQGPDNVRGIVAGIRKAVANGEIEKPSHYLNEYDVPPPLKAAYQQAGSILDNKGKTYQVSIAAHPDQFLDWDKPLSQQTPEVRKALHGLGFEDWSSLPIKDTMQSWNAQHMPGQKIYESLSRSQPVSDVGQETRSATEALRQAGIQGIKYLDQGSRAAGEGSRNFVVFDDSLISIMKKYGIALPFFAGMSRLAQRQPQGQGQQ